MSDAGEWQKRIKAARKYDASAREVYARDRKYARGDSGGKISSNLAGVYIDVLTDFLYAQNPEPQCQIARATVAAGDAALRDAARKLVEADGDAMAKVAQAAMQAGMQSALTDPRDEAVGAVAIEARKQMVEQLVQQRYDEMRREQQRQTRNKKAVADTMEIVVDRLWQDGRLKLSCRAQVRTALTVGIGVLKASWQERTAGESPATATRMADLQDNLQRLRALREDDETADTEAREAEIQRQMEALRGEQERVIQRGYVIDMVQPEDFQLAEGYPLWQYLDAPWMAHRFWLRLDDAKAKYPGISFDSATRYAARKPSRDGAGEAGYVAQIEARDADAFVKGGQGEAQEADWVACWEIWDATSGHILTLCEGVDKWLRDPWQPDATERFFPFFLLLLYPVDGQRHPQSYISRSYKLLDEYDRIAQQYSTHRRRIVPKTGFNSSLVKPTEAAKLASGDVGEMIPLDVPANVPVGDVLHEIAYPTVNPGLYEDGTIMQKIERVWGAQEAMTGAINTAKTATEAQIQASGFSARTTSRRDLLEDMLSDLAKYTAEVAIQNLSAEEVSEIAGPNALWPEWNGPDSLKSMLSVEIRAGSSGKPNTTAEKEAWSVLLPILQQGIAQIGQLRQSDPADVADRLENLLRMTGERMGDRLDFDQLVPEQGSAPSMPQPQPGPMQMPAPEQPPAAGTVPGGPMNGVL